MSMSCAIRFLTFYILLSVVIGDFGYNKCEQHSWFEKYKLCGGKFQSPIAIQSSKAIPVELPALEMVGYHNSLTGQLMLHNNGHSVVIRHSDKSKTVDVAYIFGAVFDQNKIYALDHLHFHWGRQNNRGSEHTLNGIRYPMEMHMVHVNREYKTVSNALNFKDGLAVLGVFFQLQPEDNKILNSILKALPNVRELHRETKLNASIVLSLLMPHNTDLFYTYRGSLTTPPCNEVVTWIIFPTPVPISFRQMCKFRSLSGSKGKLVDNYRKLQKLESRKVYSRLWHPAMKMQYNTTSFNSTTLTWF